MTTVELDTQSVLNRDYPKSTIAKGLPGIDTPIFDFLASTRFAWDGEN